MANSSCKVTIKTAVTHPRRSVAFLVHSAPYVNIEEEFNRLGASAERYHRKSFDFWVGNFPSDRYHKWDKTQFQGQYTRCLVFRNVSEGERLYGFICEPKNDYEMCVLVRYVQKKRKHTDTAELARVERMRTDPAVKAALRNPDLFTEEKEHD